MNKVMIDIETLSTNDNATIVSIAAVIFSQNTTGREFYMVCDLDQHRDIDHATVKWWLQQPDIPRAVFKGTEKSFSLVKCLHALVLFFEVNDVNEVWACSPDFDCRILKNACDRLGIDWPMKFYQYRDVRTVRKLLPEHMIPEKTVYAHNALADCYYQIAVVQVMLKAIEKFDKSVPEYWQDAYITKEYTTYDYAGDAICTYESREDAHAGLIAYAKAMKDEDARRESIEDAPEPPPDVAAKIRKSEGFGNDTEEGTHA